MNKKEIIALDATLPALTSRQRERVIKRVQPKKKGDKSIALYSASMQSFKGLAVLRYFIVMFDGDNNATDFNEVVRIYYESNGSRHIFTRPCKPVAYIYDAYNYEKEIRYVGEPSQFDYKAQNRVSVDAYTSVFSVPSFLKMRGYNSHVWPSSIKHLFTRQGETLCKQGFYDFLDFAAYRQIYPCQMVALKICRRNHYRPKKVRLYLDYIDMLEKLGLDYHNAHYACPSNLKQAHSDMLARIWRRNAREEERREKIAREEEIQKYSHKYEVRMGKYLSLLFVGDNLFIRPLQSVQEFAEEADAMHHCVFECGYYKKGNSLILSARDSEGKRLATIEVDTRKGTILQCYAAGNETPSRDADIRSLLEKNMSQILKAA